MPDRVIRDELLESERWLDLPSDTHRLAYFGFLLKRIDDFGNMEGGLRGIFRFLHTFTQVKTQEATAALLSHLCDADMVRAYQCAEGREFYHVPRFRPHRQYLVRKYPPSPWDSDRKLGKNQRVNIRGLAKDQTLGEKIVDTSQPRRSHMLQGVGVGVGVGVESSLRSDSKPPLSRSRKNRANGDETSAAREVLQFLNDKAAKHYRAIAANLDLIIARLREGATVGEIKAVIVRKCREWIGTKMEKYLRPKTLFNATNFANYVGEVPQQTKQQEITDGT